MEKPKHSESSKIRLSVALATHNEEKTLPSCLESVKELADEIVVVDGSSTDNTIEIAKSFGAKVIMADNKPIFHINKQMAIDECQGEWVLQLDADEVITPELYKEIESVITPVASTTYNLQPTTYVAYWIKRKKMFLGRWIKKGGQYPDPVIRLFRRGKARLPCKNVHEQMEVEGDTGWLASPMMHYPTPSFSMYITKDNRYSTLTALEMKEKKEPVSFVSFLKYFVWEPHKVFFDLYFRHRGFMDGFPGFVFALYSGLHKASAYVKYWETTKTGEFEIEKDWV